MGCTIHTSRLILFNFLHIFLFLDGAGVFCARVSCIICFLLVLQSVSLHVLSFNIVISFYTACYHGLVVDCRVCFILLLACSFAALLVTDKIMMTSDNNINICDNVIISRDLQMYRARNKNRKKQLNA